MSQAIQLINGQWQVGLGHEVSSVNPARNEVIWHGQSASKEQVNTAVESARTAFESWADMDIEARIAITEKFAVLLGENKEALAITIAQETGKPLWEIAIQKQPESKWKILAAAILIVVDG